MADTENTKPTSEVSARNPLRFKIVATEEALTRANELLAKHTSEQTPEEQIEAREHLLTAREHVRELKQEILAREVNQSFAPQPEQIEDPDTIARFVARVLSFQEQKIKEIGTGTLFVFDRDYFTITRMSDATRLALADGLMALAFKHSVSPLLVWQEIVARDGKLSVEEQVYDEDED